MIWLWIVAAWILSFIALGKKKIRIEHYIWLLLPVDMYGIPVGGFTVKPYMIFCIFLLLRTLREQHWTLKLRSRWALASGVLVLLFVVVNMINNQSGGSLVSALLLPVVWLFGVVYVSRCNERAAEEIPNAMLAAGIGFGLVFVVAYITMLINPGLPHLLTYKRTVPGIIMEFRNMQDGMLVRMGRLRGFSFDPNTVASTFFFASIVAVLRIVKRKAGIREYLALILSAACIFLSNSRTGMICFCLLVVACFVVGYNMADTATRNRIKLLMLGLTAVLIVLCVTGVVPRWISTFLAQFENRSGLYDEYGRMSIWEEVIGIWLEEGAFLGIGFGQVQYYTEVGRGAHNTWLELLCAGGILVGGTLLVYFCLLLYSALRYPLENSAAKKSEFAWTMALGLLIVMISLFAVDHLMFSYLWFTAMVVSAITSGSLQVVTNDPPNEERCRRLPKANRLKRNPR